MSRTFKIEYLTANHNFKTFDDVSVTNLEKNILYNGKIHSIIKKPLIEYNYYLVDHFYISFSQDIYEDVLLQGWAIIYNNKECVISSIKRDNNGKITKINTIIGDSEIEIDINNINAILIWRIAFDINHK